MPAVAVQQTPHMSTVIADILSGAAPPAASPIASGGTVTIVGGYVYHKFTTSGTLLIYSAGDVDYILVGGGGGGGSGAGSGGGGAGEVEAYTAASLVAGAYPAVIGAAGVGGTTAGANATAGGDSTFNGKTALGGGRGGGQLATTTGGNGGSGGGGGYSGAPNGGSSTAAGGGLGTAGGACQTGGGLEGRSGGGGGGATQAGATGSGLVGAKGGDGSVWVDGSTYGGGGGGGSRSDAGGTGGAGGAGGGGAGTTTTGGAATANTGGGGGGAGYDGSQHAGGNGAAGVVIVRYPLVTTNYATGGTVTSDGTQVIHTFTVDGTFALAQAGLLAVSYAAVGAGGGGSGGTNAVNVGSGGAGGTIRSGTANVVASQTVTIGTGGAGVAGTGNTGGNGGSSVLGTIATATGGNGAPPSVTGGANADFAGGTNSGGQDSGGGAGAAAVGGATGIGGAGAEWPASSGTFYGGGGGGSEGSTGQAGGVGGGGAGRHFSQGGNGTSGTANTGGGGGGSYNGAAASGNGGSGVVIVRYSPGAFQPYAFSDDFARSDRNLSGDNGWTVNSSPGNTSIVSNQAVCSGNTNGSWMTNTGGSVSNTGHFAEVTIAAGLAGDIGGVICRYTDANNFYAGRCAKVGSDTYELYKRVGGTYTLLGSLVEAFPAEPFRVRLSAVGTAITFQLWSGTAWVTKVSATDAALATGSPGWFSQRVAGDVTYDDYAQGFA